MTDQGGAERRKPAADRFSDLCAAVARRLPFGLPRVVPPNFLGFAAINGFTFGVDLSLLTLAHSWLDLPVRVSITIGYLIAFSLSFVLNRWLNFHSHAPIGRQAVLFFIVILVNYAVILLGVGGGLAALGVQYHVARLVAGACEAVFIYSAMRWVVFAKPAGSRRATMR